jgi:predicted nucleotidyltransferase
MTPGGFWQSDVRNRGIEEVAMEARVALALEKVVAAAREAFGPDLKSVVLYGSGAEDALRPTSDVNVIVVVSAFDAARAARIRDAVVVAGATVRLRAMFLLEREVADAAEAFAVKFEDVVRRHRVLYGSDPFAGLHVSRGAAVARLRQVLLNLVLRLRERIVTRGDDAPEMARIAADAAGPLRACAAEILALEGRPAASPREALTLLAGGPLDELSAARETGTVPAGAEVPLVVRLIALAESLRERAARLA